MDVPSFSHFVLPGDALVLRLPGTENPIPAKRTTIEPNPFKIGSGKTIRLTQYFVK